MPAPRTSYVCHPERSEGSAVSSPRRSVCTGGPRSARPSRLALIVREAPRPPLFHGTRTTYHEPRLALSTFNCRLSTLLLLRADANFAARHRRRPVGFVGRKFAAELDRVR